MVIILSALLLAIGLVDDPADMPSFIKRDLFLQIVGDRLSARFSVRAYEDACSQPRRALNSLCKRSTRGLCNGSLLLYYLGIKISQQQV